MIRELKWSLPITQKAKNSPGKSVFGSGVDLIKNAAATGTRAVKIDKALLDGDLDDPEKKEGEDLTEEEDVEEKTPSSVVLEGGVTPPGGDGKNGDGKNGDGKNGGDKGKEDKKGGKVPDFEALNQTTKMMRK